MPGKEFKRKLTMFRYCLKLSSRKPRLLFKLARLQAGIWRGRIPPFREVEIATTYDCNLSCTHCSCETLKGCGKALSLDDYRRLGQECKKHGVPIVAFTGGEPLVDTRLAEIIRYFNPQDTIIAVTTNGTLLDGEKLKGLIDAGLDTLTVSLDSPHAETHDKFRNSKGSFEKAVQAIKTAVAAGIDTTIIMTVHHENIHGDFPDMIDFAQKLGVKLHVSLAAPSGKWATDENMRKYALTGKDTDFLESMRKRYSFIRRDLDGNYCTKGCPAGTERICLTPDGEVMPCTKIHVSFGNIRENTLYEIRERILGHTEFSEIPGWCIAAEDRNFIGSYMRKSFDRKKSLVPEEEFFGGQKKIMRENTIDEACILCGENSYETMGKPVKDYEYRIPGQYTVIKCTSCGLVRQQKVPGYGELEKYYPKDYHAHQPCEKNLLTGIKKILYLRRVRRIMSLVGPKARILDVGCGNCTLLKTIRKMGDYELHGLDIKKLDVDYEKQGIDFREGNLEEMDYEKDYFDLVSMDNVIEHVPNPRTFLEKTSRIMSSGGHIVGTTPNISSIEHVLFGRYWGLYHIPRHTYFFTPKTLRGLLESTGFANVKYPPNMVGGYAISLQNYLRRNQEKTRQYKKARYFPIISLATSPLSLLASLAGKNSTLDFTARKK